MKKETINLIIGCLAGLLVGLILTLLVFRTSNNALDSVSAKLGNCITIGDVIEQTGLKLSDESKESIKEIDANLKVCLSKEYKEKLDESLKDVDLSEYSDEDLFQKILGFGSNSSLIETPSIDFAE